MGKAALDVGAAGGWTDGLRRTTHQATGKLLCVSMRVLPCELAIVSVLFHLLAIDVSGSKAPLLRVYCRLNKWVRRLVKEHTNAASDLPSADPMLIRDQLSHLQH